MLKTIPAPGPCREGKESNPVLSCYIEENKKGKPKLSYVRSPIIPFSGQGSNRIGTTTTQLRAQLLFTGLVPIPPQELKFIFQRVERSGLSSSGTFSLWGGRDGTSERQAQSRACSPSQRGRDVHGHRRGIAARKTRLCTFPFLQAWFFYFLFFIFFASPLFRRAKPASSHFRSHHAPSATVKPQFAKPQPLKAVRFWPCLVMSHFHR